MRPPASWEEQQRALTAARVLADFANLEPGGIESFRAAHPDFVPQAWWDYRPTTFNGTPSPKMQWEIVQLNLRDAWRYQFKMPLLHSMFLLTAVFDPEDIGEDHPLFVTGLHILDLESYPYHEAIQWLHGQSWRLKTCLYCKKHFVAEHAKTKFCSYGEPEDDDNFTPNCFQAHRRKYQQEYWDECRNRTNERRRQKYQSEKKTKRSRHAKRKTLRQG